MSLWDFDTGAGRARWRARDDDLPVHADDGKEMDAADFLSPDKDFFYFEWDSSRAPFAVYVHITDRRRRCRTEWWNNQRMRIVLDVYRCVAASIVEFVGTPASIIVAECGLVGNSARGRGRGHGVVKVKRYPVDFSVPIVDITRAMPSRRCYEYIAPSNQALDMVLFDTIFITLGK